MRSIVAVDQLVRIYRKASQALNFLSFLFLIIAHHRCPLPPLSAHSLSSFFPLHRSPGFRVALLIPVSNFSRSKSCLPDLPSLSHPSFRPPLLSPCSLPLLRSPTPPPFPPSLLLQSFSSSFSSFLILHSLICLQTLLFFLFGSRYSLFLIRSSLLTSLVFHSPIRLFFLSYHSPRLPPVLYLLPFLPRLSNLRVILHFRIVFQFLSTSLICFILDILVVLSLLLLFPPVTFSSPVPPSLSSFSLKHRYSPILSPLVLFRLVVYVLCSSFDVSAFQPSVADDPSPVFSSTTSPLPPLSAFSSPHLPLDAFPFLFEGPRLVSAPCAWPTIIRGGPERNPELCMNHCSGRRSRTRFRLQMTSRRVS